MRKKYFCEEQAFEFVWNNADADGLWNGNAEVLARRFNVSADEAYDTLSQLTDHNRLERVGSESYIITRWRERDDLGEGELES